MQIYDIIMLLVLLAAIGFGAWKGLSWQLASLCAIFLSYFVAYQFREPVSEAFGLTQEWEGIFVMLGLYLVSSLVIWIAFGYIRKIIDRVKLQDFDRHAGAVLGAVKGVILCMIITLFAVALLSENQKRSICCSYSGYFMAKIIDKADYAMPEEVHNVIGPYLDKLDRELSRDHPDHDHASHEQIHTAHSEEPDSSDLDPLGIEAARTAKKILDTGNEFLENVRK